jgi:hypothetical protein
LIEILQEQEIKQRRANRRLAIVTVQCSADAFVVKNATFAKRQTFMTYKSELNKKHYLL